MKYSIVILLAFFSLQSFSQSKDDLKYLHDKMEDAEYLMSKRPFTITEGKQSVIVDISLTKTLDGSKWKYNGLNCISYGLGCGEEDELIILFTNGKKIKMTMWNKFNCDGYAFFDLDKEYGEVMFARPIQAIRFTNGRTNKSVEKTLTPQESTYFIKLIESVEIFNKTYKAP